jgi:two-component system alkaline phosphatase synthesis response regulator PhoP
MPGHTVLVVDDEQQIVEVVRDYLEQAGFRVFVARDGQTAMSVVRQDHPDLVVLDLMLPGGKDGLDICREIRRDPGLSETPIVMLTARAELTDRLIGLELGADDYITKPFSPREVVARAKAVLRRMDGHGTPSPTLVAGELALDLRGRLVTVSGRVVELTPTEFDLLATMMREPGRVFTRMQLVEKVYDVAYEGYDRAIDSHISNLRQKIEPDSHRPTYIQTVYGVGYRLAGRPR